MSRPLLNCSQENALKDLRDLFTLIFRYQDDAKDEAQGLMDKAKDTASTARDSINTAAHGNFPLEFKALVKPRE